MQKSVNFEKKADRFCVFGEVVSIDEEYSEKTGTQKTIGRFLN